MKEKIRQFVRSIIYKCSDLRKIEEQLETQHYILNNFIDITQFPKAVGDLRLLHEADAVLIKIFAEVCKNNNLTYWLDYGTLLGAVRHKGFIPWDDDQDVSMPYDDFERAKNVLPKELGKYGISAEFIEKDYIKCIGIGYKHEMTGTWLDVFRTTPIKLSDIKKLPDSDMIMKAQSRFIKKQACDSEYFIGGIEEIYYCADLTLNRIPYLLKYDDIFPLSTITYEGTYYNAPRNLDIILRQLYGDYMSFPKSGILHHEMGRGPLCEWHKAYNIDMNDVIQELNEIYDKVHSKGNI